MKIILFRNGGKPRKDIQNHILVDFRKTWRLLSMLQLSYRLAVFYFQYRNISAEAHSNVGEIALLIHFLEGKNKFLISFLRRGT